MLHTPLYDWHLAHSARMVEFGGWEMPVQYTSVIEEHLATRTAVGLTDVSHMGRLCFTGRHAGAFLDGLLTRNVAALRPGQVRYSLILNNDAGILDDVLIGRFDPDATTPLYILVVNASNRLKIVDVIHEHLARRGDGVVFSDRTQESAMLAIQGPKAIELLTPYFDEELASIKYYNGRYVHFRAPFPEGEVLLTRTGYTGEDGVEVTFDAGLGGETANTILQLGTPFGLQPVGLGARDTLRLEAGMPLYGHEMNEQTTPFEAGLQYACCLDGADYPGRDMLRQLVTMMPKRQRIGLMLDDRRPAREHCGIFVEGRSIGETTSGTFAPTLGKPIAMGFVPPEFSSPGRVCDIDIRGKMASATVVELPFYKRS